MKKAIVVGHTGQDGTYLSSLLLKKGYEVIGISSKLTSKNSYSISIVDIRHLDQTENLVQKTQPDEIYFLAAVHQSSSDNSIEDAELFQRSFDINVKGLLNFFEAIRKHSSRSKLFYAASSHVFGSPDKSPQDESSPFKPNCIYGITKTAGIHTCNFYRTNHHLFASVGIFYNHESPLRESKYVSKKIVETAVAIKKGFKNELILGNLESQIDWGFAPDYMEAVYHVMQLKQSDDFVISSGTLHTIKDFAKGVFNSLQLDWKKYVKVDPLLITKKQKQNLFGNNKKIRNTTGWAPTVDFSGLIKILVDEELKKYAER